MSQSTKTRNIATAHVYHWTDVYDETPKENPPRLRIEQAKLRAVLKNLIADCEKPLPWLDE